MYLSENERNLISQGLLALMANVRTLKTSLYDEEVYEALDVYTAKIKVLNDKICLEMDQPGE